MATTAVEAAASLPSSFTCRPRNTTVKTQNQNQNQGPDLSSHQEPIYLQKSLVVGV